MKSICLFLPYKVRFLAFIYLLNFTDKWEQSLCFTGFNNMILFILYQLSSCIINQLPFCAELLIISFGKTGNKNVQLFCNIVFY